MSQTIQIEETITVGQLAEKLGVPVAKLVGELMKNGVMATVNERIDFDTAQIITSELGLEIKLAKAEATETAVRQKRQATGEPRPPVVAMMGHVDHGKTSLLDAIAKADVAKGEAGGITQHISAFQVTHNKRQITLLDTPGHEAFAALREHGAQLTDLVVIVVAADDGVKPQTLEAIKFAKKAGVKIMVAINKIDKEAVDINRTKQQLAEKDVLLEGWGGDVVCVEVSAKTGKGIPELLDMILLLADVEDLRAETKGPAEGLIIESHLEKGKGPVGVALVEQGILCPGDFIVAGTTYAKIRSLTTTDDKQIDRAGPATPVVITGFKALPQFGDEFKVVGDEKTARSQVQAATQASRSVDSHAGTTSSDLIRLINRKKQLTELNCIIKADVQGSLTSVMDSLKALETDEVAVRFVGSGVGSITENDIHMAATSRAIIYGFNVSLPAPIKQLASRDRVSVRLFKVIYELIDDAKAELSKLLVPEIVEKDLGRLLVKGIFKITKTEVICGGEVTKGKLGVPAVAKVMRGKDQLAEVEIVSLKRGPQEVREVSTGEMCGVSFKSAARVDLQEGDHLEFFTRETVVRTL